MGLKAGEVAKDVYLVGGPGVSRGDDCCVYLVRAGEELVLIDAGAGRSVERILDNIRKLGFDPERVTTLIATHGHIDHICGIHELKERLGLKVAAHELELPAIEGGRPELTGALYYGVRYQPVKVDLVLRGDEEELAVGDVVLHCLHTPGHTPGSISVYFDVGGVRVLFGQDIHGPFSEAWGSDMKQWQESMRRLIELGADVLCEGHFGVYTPADRVKGYIEGYLRRFS